MNKIEITLEEAKALKHGTTIYHMKNKNADNTAQRWRVNGKVQTWKKDPSKVKVPVKNGLRYCDYLTEHELNLVTLWNWKLFDFISDARKYQRELRESGYKTRLIRFAGISDPHSIVYFKMK